MNPITFEQAIIGFDLAAAARQLSQNTLNDYHTTFRKFVKYIGDVPFVKITVEQVRTFMSQQTVSRKTLLNYHTGLSALWTWAVRDKLAPRHILHQVERPKPEQPAIVEFSKDDVEKLLEHCGKTNAYTRRNKKESAHSLTKYSSRNRAIILLLLDTGLRVSEICSLSISDVDLRNQQLRVWGKGRKERMIPFSARTGQALWKYLATRANDRADAPLFSSTATGDKMLRTSINLMLTRLAHRAGVSDCNPHRFRHTFAINYLRNGGDIYSLQRTIGHADLNTVKTYLAIAEADIVQAHRKASPVDNWRL